MPLDVARRLRIGLREIGERQGELWEFLRRRLPVFNLAAAAYLLDPSFMTLGETSAYLHTNLGLATFRQSPQ